MHLNLNLEIRNIHYFDKIFNEKRKKPTDDIISDLVNITLNNNKKLTNKPFTALYLFSLIYLLMAPHAHSQIPNISPSMLDQFGNMSSSEQRELAQRTLKPYIFD